MTAALSPKYAHGYGDPWVVVAEECSEVIKEHCKVQRFGMAGCPERAAAGHQSPRARLVQEIADVQVSIEILVASGEVTEEELQAGRCVKAARLLELYGIGAAASPMVWTA